MTINRAELVGATVRAELARKRIPQVELASRLHLSQTAVSRRLTGRKAFDVCELEVVAEMTGVRVEYLVSERRMGRAA